MSNCIYADIHTYGDVMLTATARSKAKGFVLPSTTLIMAGVIIGLSLSNALFIHLYRGAVDDLTAYKTQVSAASAKADAENQAKLDAARENTAEVARLYAADAARIGSAYRSRLDGLQRDCHRQALPAVAGPASGSDGPASHDRPPATEFDAACIRLELDCARTTLQAVHLQDWVVRICK